MSSTEQGRGPTGANDLRSARQADDAQQAGVKRAWTPPTVMTFKVTDTQGIFPGPPGDGINNISNTG